MTTAEICCRGCRTPFQGVCRERGCWCHIEQRAVFRDTGRRPVADPTGNRAAANVDKQRKKRRRKER